MPVMSAIESAFCRSTPWRSVARRWVLPWTLTGRPLSGDVLEIGGGSGAMAAGAAHTFPDTRLTVTDVDNAMVEAATTRLSGFSNVTVTQADVTCLPFEPASFDAVTSYLMLHHVIDWVDALAEIARVLKPRGELIGYDLTDTRFARWIHRVDRSPHRLVARHELADALKVVGFTEVTVRPSGAEHLMRFYARKPDAR